ncbi:hypothetical protein BE221DRAFT_168853 [Ostreococcus tauri]|uniref:Uncharacterized protein n=1 Tax=Ostreococcus tauri TaxID=70448 RepID=A0A1Y5IFG3_OSTTA|nr:hypothetical protein BE221DRAFT_168853 [Ostreococcus tauri]
MEYSRIARFTSPATNASFPFARCIFTRSIRVSYVMSLCNVSGASTDPKHPKISKSSVNVLFFPTAGNEKFPSSPYASSGGISNVARSPTRIVLAHASNPSIPNPALRLRPTSSLNPTRALTTNCTGSMSARVSLTVSPDDASTSENRSTIAISPPHARRVQTHA